MEIFSVGYEVPGGVAQYVPLESTISLLDADLIIFAPGLGDFETYSSYLGKPSLGEHDSFEVKERVAHWRRELLQAFSAGKFVVVFLNTPEEAYAQTGTKSFSGTGRSRQTTIHVAPVSSYDALPITLEDLVVASGSGMRPAGDLQYFATFWREFGAQLRYEVHFSGRVSRPLLHTKAGDRIVATSIIKGSGAVVLIPPFAHDRAKFVVKKQWTAEARKFGPQLVACLVEMAKAVRSSQEITPPPEWSRADGLRSDVERNLEEQISTLSREVETIEAQRASLRAELDKAVGLRRLLYEKGRQLETVVVDALRLLGFEAESFREGESEFDAIFTSREGRFLGETEGKDNHAMRVVRRFDGRKVPLLFSPQFQIWRQRAGQPRMLSYLMANIPMIPTLASLSFAPAGYRVR